MPSPFPGMDPYLEDTSFWPGFHHALATEVCYQLNDSLPEAFYANMEMSPELGIVMEPDGNGGAPRGARKRIIPDVIVLKRPGEGAGVAVAEPARRPLSPFFEFAALSDEPARHYFVEIREVKR